MDSKDGQRYKSVGASSEKSNKNEEKLKEVKMTSLEERRQRGDVIQNIKNSEW